MAVIPIEIEKLSKWYRTGFLGRKTPTLHGIPLSVAEGVCFGFLGPNGAGKSTTIKTLVGLLAPSDGVAHVFGRPASDPKARARLGYLPENPNFPDHLSGEEVLRYTAALFGIHGAERERRVGELLELTKIASARKLAVRKYSKGMVQRLGIAQALVNDPSLVIFDEPMSGLDPLGRRDIKDLIIELRRRQKTVFFSTHIISDVEEVCDEMAIIVGGRIVKHGSVSSFFRDDAREIEVIARTDVNALRARGVPVGKELVTFTVGSQQEAQALLAELWSHGGQVINLKAKRYGLEEIFLEAVGARAAPKTEGR